MARCGAAILVALLGSIACSSDPPDNHCSTPGELRCSNNALQTCMKDNLLGGPPTWSSGTPCPSPLVCRVNTAPDGIIAGEDGCFAPNAFCPAEGFTSCTNVLSAGSPLWTCTLRASDQTLQWSRTDCAAQVPQAFCAGGFLPGDPPAACMQLVANCPVFPVPDVHCEGNVLFQCAGPTVADNKVVFDWVTTDCALNGQVCRIPPMYATPVCAVP